MGKWIAEILCVLVIGSILSACGSGQPARTITPGPSRTTIARTQEIQPASTATNDLIPTSQPAPTLNVDPAKLRGIKVVFWHAWAGKEGELLQATIDRFNLTNPWGIYVEALSLGGYNELYQDVTATLMTPQMPDLVVAYPEQFLAWELAQPTAMIPLDPYVSDPKWGFTAQELADFPVKFADQDFVNGNRAGIPAQRSISILFYNTSWAKELGFSSPPATPDEFASQVCAASQANKNADIDKIGTGGWVLNTDHLTILAWIKSFGGEIWQPVSGRYQFTSSAVQNTFTYMRKLYDQGCIWAGRDPYPEDYFSQRKALVVTASIEDIPLESQAMVAANNPDQWTVIPFPALDGDPVVFSSGASYYIFKSTPERQLAAWLVVRSLSDPQYLAKQVVLSGDYPVRTSTVDYLADYRHRYPQWDVSLQLLPYIEAGPQTASWREIRNVLSDAALQIFQPETKPDQVNSILALLQATTEELLARPTP